MNRFRTIVLSTALVAASAMAAPAAAQDLCGVSVVERDPGWTSIAAPEFDVPLGSVGTSPTGAQLLAAVPNDPDRLVVGWPNELAITADGGCTWHSIFPRQEVDTPVVNCNVNPTFVVYADPGCLHLYDVDIALEPQPKIYVQLYSLGAGGTKNTLVMSSSDWGATWQRAGLPTSAGTGPLTVAPSDPKTIYVTRELVSTLLISPWGGASVVWVSRDGGATWKEQPVVLPGSGAGLSTIQPLRVSPLDASEIWGVSQEPYGPGFFREFLVRSRDEGATWQRVESPVTSSAAPIVRSFDVSASAARNTVIAVASSQDAWVSSNGGQDWVTGLESNSGEMFTNLHLSKESNFLFVIGNGNLVARIDLRSGRGKAIKSRAFIGSEAAATDTQHGSSNYSAGSGLLFLAGCDGTCYTHMFRYSGRGT